MDAFRIAHISDLHFAKITKDFRQFLSKRWLGNLNLLLFRKDNYQTAHLWDFAEFFQKLGVETVCITGDFASTSLPAEFEEARQFVSQFHVPVMTLPGNHDAYTKSSEREKRFYQYFPDDNLKNTRVTCKKLSKGWWWLGLDCAIATSVIFSDGKFFPEMEERMESFLSTIPENDKVIVGNHFPLFRSNPRHDLKRCDHLQRILKKYPQIKLYLHGHDHKAYLIDRSDRGLPLVLNAGSCAHLPRGTFFLLDLFEDRCEVKQYLVKENQEGFSWVVRQERSYLFH